MKNENSSSESEPWTLQKAVERGLKPVPAGTSDWARMVRNSYCVDKTLILKDLIDQKKRVVLFTRPRRFGKTTMMRMLKAFYEKEYVGDGDPQPTVDLFKDKKIWAAGEKYRKEQGAHPVIFLSFKDVKFSNRENCFGKVFEVISSEASRHSASVRSDWDAEGANKKSLIRVMTREKVTREDYASALGLLCEAIHFHHQAKPVILIDEYDMPITTASTNGFYDEMCEFFRVFLPGAMKDCEHCHLGIMTGVLRVAKEGILSGLNNPDVWSVFESPFSQYFGFTEDEVKAMCEYYGVPEKELI